MNLFNIKFNILIRSKVSAPMGLMGVCFWGLVGGRTAALWRLKAPQPAVSGVRAGTSSAGGTGARTHGEGPLAAEREQTGLHRDGLRRGGKHKENREPT